MNLKKAESKVQMLEMKIKDMNGGQHFTQELVNRLAKARVTKVQLEQCIYEKECLKPFLLIA